MSQFEQIFLDPGRVSIGDAADALAKAMGLQESRIREDVVLSGSVGAVEVGGTLEANIYAETSASTPEEESIFDDMPLVFELRVAKAVVDQQRAAAWTLYQRMTATLGWRSALTSEYSELVATYDGERGLRTFPSGTLSEGTHADVWR